MSNENRQEDTVLGAALGRAIETQSVRQTHFAGSRLAARLEGRERRSPLMPLLAAAAAVVLGLALGSALLAQRGPDGVAQPGATATPGGSPAVSPSPTASEGNDRILVYFARDQLPPLGARVFGTFDGRSAETRIMSRLMELWRADPSEVPTGATNVMKEMGRGANGDWKFMGASVALNGDIATVSFSEGVFDAIRGAAMSEALLQQLVYTITEEPSIRSARIQEDGKPAQIDQLVVDQPLAREAVFGYSFSGTEARSIANPGSDAPQEIAKVTLSNGPQPDTTAGVIGRLTVDVREIVPPCEAQTCPPGPRLDPSFTAELTTGVECRVDPTCVSAKALITVRIPDNDGPAGSQPDTYNWVGVQGPVRFVQSVVIPQPCGTGAACTEIRIYVDDARPWRVSVEPVGSEDARINIDIGGRPRSISESVAVYGPLPGNEVARTFTLSGAARVFEAHVAWRLKDKSDREIATGFALASIGTSPVWGTFSTEVKVPDGVSGDLLLEVFWPSPQDGSDLDKVQIPIRVP